MDILSKLPERLAELMAERELKPVSLANEIGISRNTITRYLQGVRLPSFENFVKLLDVFHCSADFLIGLTDNPSYNVVYKPVVCFATRFQTLLTERKISQYALHQQTHFSYDNFNSWLKGKTSPYVDNLVKLANAFACSVDELLGRI